jgi:deoxyadenosine/deoxycytidine kinase
MKKIGFSGMSGCGKTTLLNEVKKILSLKSKTELTPKSDLTNPFDEDKKLSFESQFYNFSQCINKENIVNDNSSGFLLCDTTILDYFTQWRYFLVNRELTPSLQQKDKLLQHMFAHWIKTYDNLFFIRVKTQISNDEDSKSEVNNNMDPEYVTNTEKIYTHIFEEFGIKSFEIWNNTSIDESAHKMIEIISQLQNGQL